MDGLARARTPSWVVGVIALVLAMLFGATIGAPTSHAGVAHQLLAPDHHAWSGGDGGERAPLMLHAEGEQVETPDAAGHALAQLPAGAVVQLMPAASAEPPAGAPVDHAPDRCVLQVWRT
ncbi:hypothetical protein ACFO1B_38325 [Dactylosporangium siamense]|uniref:Uncharacterized protein n=1 Tax=Dactylosporangium siamense TaxID=685454 RepID=A0A919UBV4_9ACTN|nr:hypothetical protein [Dactylosporangium siamense]GIG49632.1 hypothetical protein Dsi01nite_076730 [Dactylosporangium siamense]